MNYSRLLEQEPKAAFRQLAVRQLRGRYTQRRATCRWRSPWPSSRSGPRLAAKRFEVGPQEVLEHLWEHMEAG